jgi:hypothetical protein
VGVIEEESTQLVSPLLTKDEQKKLLAQTPRFAEKAYTLEKKTYR